MVTQPDTLHARLAAELERRLAVARAATPGPWTIGRTTEPNWGTAPAGRIGDQVYADGEWWPKAVTVEGTHVCKLGEGARQIATMERGYLRGGFAANAAHIALHDPADAVRRYTGELEVLQRHVRDDEDGSCAVCHEMTDDEDADGNRYQEPMWLSWPCPDVRSLARRLGVETDGE